MLTEYENSAEISLENRNNGINNAQVFVTCQKIRMKYELLVFQSFYTSMHSVIVFKRLEKDQMYIG